MVGCVKDNFFLAPRFQPLGRWPAASHATAWHRLAKQSKRGSGALVKSLATQLQEAGGGALAASISKKVWVLGNLGKSRQYINWIESRDLEISFTNFMHACVLTHAFSWAQAASPPYIHSHPFTFQSKCHWNSKASKVEFSDGFSLKQAFPELRHIDVGQPSSVEVFAELRARRLNMFFFGIGECQSL